jgi:hypothetical protein
MWVGAACAYVTRSHALGPIALCTPPSPPLARAPPPAGSPLLPPPAHLSLALQVITSTALFGSLYLLGGF